MAEPSPRPPRGRKPRRASSAQSSADQSDSGELPIRVIRKYPNRRLYDTSTSRHLTQDELYDLVAAGSLVRVEDSKSGQDITNQTLAQAMIERDPAKLALFPPWVFHWMIRSQEQAMSPFMQWLWAVAAQTLVGSPSASMPPMPPWMAGIQPPAGGPPAGLTPWDWMIRSLQTPPS